LIVSTIEPRKNHLNLLTAWERLRLESFPKLKLIVVGALGWHHKSIIQKFRPWLERAEVFVLEDVLASELRALYKHARATVCPSFGEGFDFSGVEAMKSGGVVVASDIAVHREIYAESAEYFNPYSVDDMTNAIHNVVSESNAVRREDLISSGAITAERYSHQLLVQNWRTFLTSELA
jgi:glycosyltransferase involved in cell wall biosynthesis